MIPCVIIRLSLLANLWLASAAVAQERDSADRSNMAPDATAKPGPDQHDGDQEPHKETKTEPAEPTIATSTSICLLVESAAQAHGLPFEFFGRLIWQESGFKPNAVGPMTRSGQRARGVAQFMPGTASDRGLFDLFDPVSTVEKTYRILENRDPIIIASKFRSHGTHTFYQVRIGADTRASAGRLCAALHKAGGTCLALRNWVGKVRAL